VRVPASRHPCEKAPVTENHSRMGESVHDGAGAAPAGEGAPPILALQGASNAVIQEALRAFADRRRAEGVRVAGAVEEFVAGSAETCLRDLATGRRYRIHQDLGPGSLACRLQGAEIAEACEALRLQIIAGCDLAVLSKFGKLEAARAGLVAAFGAAVETGTPVLTAVSPLFTPQWRAFSGNLSRFAGPEPTALDDWWRALAPAKARPGHRRAG